MATKERYQNPTCGDQIKLRLFTYNSNNRRSVQSIEEVKIYTFDPTEVSSSNPTGRRLVETIAGSAVTLEEEGQYLLTIDAQSPEYTIGRYQDSWTVIFEDGECAEATINNNFQIYSDLWFTTAVPPIYDFKFDFRPNRIRKGSKRYLIIKITPNVPRGADIEPYYNNLAIVSDIRVSIELACGDCVPVEQDLRLLVDRELVEHREKNYAYYFLDTTEFDCGTYNIWFETAFGESLFLSDKNSFQIHD